MIGAALTCGLVAGFALAWLLRLRGPVAAVPPVVLALWGLLPLTWTPATVVEHAGGAGGLSVTAAALALLALAERCGASYRLPREYLQAVALLVAPAGLLVYGTQWGFVPLEGLYGAGFGDFRLSTALLLLGLVAWVVRAYALCLILVAGQFAFATGWLPAINLWDHLMDPLLWLWSIGWLAVSGRPSAIGKPKTPSSPGPE